jgi:hypothetical protein
LEIVVNNSKTLKKKRRLGQEEDLQSLRNNGENEKILKQENTGSSTILVDVTASDPFPFIQDILTVD